jgi:hypothetical protein
MTMTALRVNGVDLAERFGFFATSIGGWLGMTALTTPAASVSGRDGALALPAHVGTGRSVQLVLTTQATTPETRRERERGLSGLLRAGQVRVRVEDGLPGPVQIEGRLRALAILPYGPSLTPLASQATIDLICDEEVYWRDVEPATRALAVAGTRYTLTLGTAPSSPLIRLMGPATNPVLTYRDAGGAVARTAGFTVSLASTEYLDLDMRRGVIHRVASGVATNGIALLTSGQFPWALDPQDGDRGTAAWPTVEVSAGTGEVLWWRQWL